MRKISLEFVQCVGLFFENRVMRMGNVLGVAIRIDGIFFRCCLQHLPGAMHLRNDSGLSWIIHGFLENVLCTYVFVENVWRKHVNRRRLVEYKKYWKRNSCAALTLHLLMSRTKTNTFVVHIVCLKVAAWKCIELSTNSITTCIIVLYKHSALIFQTCNTNYSARERVAIEKYTRW